MAQAATRVYGGISADQRRAERRRRLMAAALEIIGTEGWSAVTVRGVCERARVGPRFFYESFEDVDALAIAVLDETVGSALAAALQAIATAPDELDAQTRAAVATIITELTDDPRRARLVFAEAHGSERLMQHRFAAMRGIAEVVVQQAQAVLDLPPEADRMLQPFALMLTGGVAELVIVWLDGGVELTRDELIDLCVELMLTTVAGLPGMAARLAQRRGS